MNTANSDQDSAPKNLVLIVAPTGKDGEVVCEILGKAGFQSRLFPDLAELCKNLQDSVGALLIAEEGLSYEDMPRLSGWLDQQPPWSDLPVIVLTTGGVVKRINVWNARHFGSRANVTLLERPFHIATLISVLEGALRARNRQFEMRDLLEQRQKLLEMEKQARTEAEKLNRAKDEFLATLSHELRTPLTTMLGWAKILNTHALDNATANRALQAIERSAKSQAQLIDDLLDVSRIITGKFQVEMKSMDLVELIHSATEIIRPAAENKRIRIQCEISDNPGPISGDFHRLQQVLWNILSNAVKFTPPEGTISIMLNRSNSQAKITIQDTGIGIRPEILPFIFERFRQADSSYTRNQGGLGLGLAIVKHIIALHSGTVTAVSDGEGRGAKFEILLPVLTVETKSLRRMKKLRKTNPRSDLQGLKILVIEDDSESRDLLGVILEKARMTVRCASSVNEALAMLREWKPDVVISDIGMPKEDGYQLIAKLRSDPITQRIPAIALTAYASDFDRSKALTAGFQFHMAKPLDPADLLDTIADLVNLQNNLS